MPKLCLKKIVIIALNTAIDQIIEIDTFEYGGVFRSSNNSVWASGKGINTARAIANFDEVKAIVLGFIGSESKSLFNKIGTENVKTEFVEISGSSRNNVTIADRNGNLIAHIQTQGFSVDSSFDLPKIQNIIGTTIAPGDVVIVSGSLPPGIDKNYYKYLISELKTLGAIVLFDSSENSLLEGAKSRPFLIKPNFEEFKTLIKKELEQEDYNTIISELRKLATLNIELIALTLGKQGVLVFQKSSKKVFQARLSIKEQYSTVNELGCGDSFLGGVAYGLALQKDIREVIRIGVSVGTANLFSNGPGCIDISKFRAFVNQVEILEVN